MQLEVIGIEIWIDGGWCVDALLEKQLREHEDLDIAIQWKDVPKLCEILAGQGCRRIQEDSQWNFVMADNQGHVIDVHAFVFDAWYSSLKNLKAIRDHGWAWVNNLRKNRKVNRDESLEDLEIPDEGLSVHLLSY